MSSNICWGQLKLVEQSADEIRQSAERCCGWPLLIEVAEDADRNVPGWLVVGCSIGGVSCVAALIYRARWTDNEMIGQIAPFPLVLMEALHTT